MSQAYAPTLELSLDTRIEKTRELPLPGRCLVAAGAEVSPDTEVLAAELPGDIDILRLADRLGFEAEQVLPAMKVKVGDQIKAGDIVCEVKSFFGLFTSTVRAPADGVVEFFTEANAHLGIRRAAKPFSVNAYIQGKVKSVVPGSSVTIETRGAIIQGIFGVGGERYGEVMVLPLPPAAIVEAGDLKDLELSQKILFGGRGYTLEALRVAAGAGVVAVVTGSIDSETLHAFVGHEIAVSVTGDEQIPLTLIVTEGFGSLPMSQRVLEVARSISGRHASVNGATQVRAGAMRPEVIVSHVSPMGAAAVETNRSLELGTKVRVIRVPYFGQFGSITALPHEPERIASGAIVRIARVRLDDGSEVVVARANLEIA